ncbi:glutamate:Na+ symporter, ESS family [Corynebacterium coyleae]|uniref:Sodium/glutamate symporter n=1 Tax=Corynebacterium coyleae TaxID=53374 RepID=A0AAP7CBU9_9CORY|nr:MULTISPECIES: sodium/glutamate symporter [Corynebacterium]MDK8240912.1 sodium/glutamate symporter [Corynebacterium coyleae]MDK8798601.1 sodium/glutamate symporter [Corynebacterium coyleae]MDK8822430.1 sodium/glutamate symporter [Corynebacterium coyleae]NJJ02838.1 sodium/glutamate symporter [Corynebacterium coyleae]OFL18015.1 sodium:glutamate symporter [Corynebacterium sp. HMSC067D03]
MAIEFNMIQTIGFAVLLLVVGRWLRNNVAFFERFAIPAPVIGGFLFALFNLVFKLTGWVDITFDTTLQGFFMTMFFTTVGFGASVALLGKAGKMVTRFLLVASVLVVLQNLLAVLLAPIVDIPSALALMTGSVSMTGGHGVSGGMAPLVEAQGVERAETVAYTAATFGLLMGSLIGGPVGDRLIKRNRLQSSGTRNVDVDDSLLTAYRRDLRSDQVMQAFIVILIAMFIGTYITDGINWIISQFTDKAAFPNYLGAMLVGILFRYISDTRNQRQYHEFVPTQEVEIIGSVALALFLAQALMTIKLWELADLAIPLVILLIAQTVLMLLFARFVTFRAMGSDYDAAVLSAGHCGFGMGATPNGVANMESVVQKYSPSRLAFFVLPIVGGMFIDFVNILVVTVFLNVL